MKVSEIYKSGKPFCWQGQDKEIYEVVPIPETNEITWRKIDGDFIRITKFKSLAWDNTNFDNKIVDYFDIYNLPTICNCDLFTVLMVTGCKCGGK